MKLLLSTPQGQFPFTVRDDATVDNMGRPKDHHVLIERDGPRGLQPIEGDTRLQEGDVVTLTRLTKGYQ